ncbi:hypothetical protein BGZ68_006508, partial [Mortierella alpina]
MFSLGGYKSHSLKAPHAIELVQLLIKNAQESRESSIQLALCEYVETLLAQLKRTVRSPLSTAVIATDDDQALHQRLQREIAGAYLTHANLVADLGYPDCAKKSRRRAEKWGGPDHSPAPKNNIIDRKPLTVIATVADGILPVDIIPPALPWKFSEPDTRLADTAQLVSCLGLLQQGSTSFLPLAVDPVANKGLMDTEWNDEEKARLTVL